MRSDVIHSSEEEEGETEEEEALSWQGEGDTWAGMGLTPAYALSRARAEPCEADLAMLTILCPTSVGLREQDETSREQGRSTEANFRVRRAKVEADAAAAKAHATAAKLACSGRETQETDSEAETRGEAGEE